MEKERKHDVTEFSNPVQPLPENEEDEEFDNLTTLDPSHVIKLIRQLITKQPIDQLTANLGGPIEVGQEGTFPESQPERDAGCASVASEQERKVISKSGVDAVARVDRNKSATFISDGEDQNPGPSMRHRVPLEANGKPGAVRNAELGEPPGTPEAKQDSGGGGRKRGLEDDKETQRLRPSGDADGRRLSGGGHGAEGVDLVSEVDDSGQEDISSRQQEGNMSAEESEEEEDPREEAGCVLWDLAATSSHAEFLVENRILEVLAAILENPYSDRIREISLGILGNLACHPRPLSSMVALQGGSLVRIVVHQLFSNHPPTLTETCRLLSAGLHGEAAVGWLEALDSEEVVGRIMWMAANTQQAQLLEKSTGLLLAMVDGSCPSALLPALLRLGFIELLTDLLATQLQQVQEGMSSQGDVILDTVLQIAEALSLSDECGAALAANHKLFSLACQVLRLSSMDGIGPSGISATVLIANLLAEDTNLVHHLTHDVVLMTHLLLLLPGASDDPGARNALWSILGRMFRQLVTVACGKLGKGDLWGVVSAVADASSAVVEDLRDHREEDLEEEQRIRTGHDVANSTSRGLEAKLVTARKMLRVMEVWSEGRGQTQGLAAVFSACSQLKKSIAVNKKSNGAFKAPQNGTRKVNAA